MFLCLRCFIFSLFQCFELSKVLLQENVLFEAEKTCDFICHLSGYLPQWRVSSPDSVYQLQVPGCPVTSFFNSRQKIDLFSNVVIYLAFIQNIYSTVMKPLFRIHLWFGCFSLIQTSLPIPLIRIQVWFSWFSLIQTSLLIPLVRIHVWFSWFSLIQTSLHVWFSWFSLIQTSLLIPLVRIGLWFSWFSLLQTS